jgi:hypothetical protein
MIRFEYIPEDTEVYYPVKLEIDLTDEATVDEQFKAWKSFMHAMTFGYIENYELVRKDLTIKE